MAEAKLPRDKYGNVIQCLLLRDEDETPTTVLAVTGSSAAMSDPVGGDCVTVEIVPKINVHVSVKHDGTAPTATTSTHPMVKDVPRIIGVSPGRTKFAFIKAAGEADGNVFITEVG